MTQETFLPLVGGAELHVLRLAQALQSRGHDVRVVTACAGPRRWEGVRVIRLPFLAGRGRRSAATVPLGYLALLPWVVWSSVVHGHYSARMSAMAGKLCRVFRRRFVLTLHGYGTLESSVGQDRRMRRDRANSMRLAHRVIGTSLEMCRVAEQLANPRKVAFIPSGVDCRLFASSRQDSAHDRAIVTVRRLVPKNGVQFVLEALPAIQRQTGWAVRLVIAGDGRLRARLESRADELGIAHSIEFRGTVENRDLPNVLTQAAVVVFASSAEATSLAALEAMAAGVPIVATPVGSYPELIGDNERGVLVDLFDSRESDYAPPESLPSERIDRLAKAISELLLDPQRGDALGAAAQCWVADRYDWTIIAQKVEQLYVGE